MLASSLPQFNAKAFLPTLQCILVQDIREEPLGKAHKLALPPQAARQRRCTVALAILDSEQTTAVTQQIIAYVVLIGIEGGWASSRMSPQPGKPNVVQTIAAAASLLVVRHSCTNCYSMCVELLVCIA